MDILRQYSEPVEKALASSLLALPDTVRPIAAHIINSGGKRIRPVLTILCARLLGREDESIYPLACSFEMLHAATLLHDDVLDNAASRRGREAAHLVFGRTRAILAGDALLAAANEQVAQHGDTALSRCFSRATVETASGEILEMDSLRNPELPLKKYLEIARGKTACLIAQACVMGALAAHAPSRHVEACEIYGHNLGLAFQLVDDALDFAPQSETGKPAGGDLREGKMTPPLRFYRQNLDEARRLEFDSHFAAGSFDEDHIEEICQCVRSEGFADKARSLADTHLENAREALATLPQAREKEILLKLTDYVRERRG